MPLRRGEKLCRRYSFSQKLHALDTLMNRLDTLLLQGDFQAGWSFFNLSLVKLGLGDELFKLATSVGALQCGERTVERR